MDIVPSILVVEDNPTTLSMVRAILEREGFKVLEALDGRAALDAAVRHLPDLVLQDLLLPDMNGYELVRQLRALPGASELPVLVISGFFGLLEDQRTLKAGFNGILMKPVEPHLLVEAVQAYLPRRDTPVDLGHFDHRLLLVDHDPVQLKIEHIHFSRLGFAVMAASNAAEALELARANRPDIMLCDVLMPEKDGFELCLDFRCDPSLASVPIVLISAQYRTELDQSLARRVGAQALVARAPHFASVVSSMRAALRAGVAPFAREPSLEIELAHCNVVIQRLERQVAASSALAQRCTFQAAQLSVLGDVADALTRSSDPEVATRDVLAVTLHAAGISKGALLMKGTAGTWALRHAIGFSESQVLGLRAFFGHGALLLGAVEDRTVLSIPSPSVSGPISTAILAAADTPSVHIVPLVSEGRGVGAILLAGLRMDVKSEDAIAFARAMGNQMVQSLDLATAFASLAASEARYRTLLESASDAIAVLSPEGIIGQVNRRWEHIVGKPAAQMVGHHIHEFSANYRGLGDGEDAESSVSSHRIRPVEVQCADGTTLLMEFSNTVLEFAGEHLVFAVGRDVTAQVRTQEQLLISERMASIGSLAAAVAHEINNPLAAIAGNLELVTIGLAELPSKLAAAEKLAEIEESVKDASDAAERVRNIVGDLKVFSRAESDELGPVDVQRVMETSLRVAGFEIRHRAQVMEEYGSVPPALANESRLGQVFLNLLVNAAQAIPEGHVDGNCITVRTLYDATRRRVITEVEDTGAGIPSDVMSKLFRPFFTTKTAGSGTGLGLAICQRVVASCGGEIHVDSTVGKGTIFRVELLATDGAPRRSPLAPPSSRAVHRSRILVIDDDPLIGKLTRRCLAPQHDVNATTNATDALARISAGERFDVILCDMMMPIMTGAGLHDALLDVAPEQAERMIFLTGGAFTQQTRSFLAELPNRQLAKPFTVEALRAIVNRRLKQVPG